MGSCDFVPFGRIWELHHRCTFCVLGKASSKAANGHLTFRRPRKNQASSDALMPNASIDNQLAEYARNPRSWGKRSQESDGCLPKRKPVPLKTVSPLQWFCSTTMAAGNQARSPSRSNARHIGGSRMAKHSFSLQRARPTNLNHRASPKLLKRAPQPRDIERTLR